MAAARKSALIYHMVRLYVLGQRGELRVEDERERLRDTLAASFDSAPAAGHDVQVGLAVGDARPLVCWIGHGELVFDDALTPEATFFFDTVETALALLCGDGDFMDAFMQGRFRSDGSLTLVFPLLSVFRGVRLEVPP